MKVAGIDPTTNQWKHASIIEDGAKNRLCVDASFTAAQIKIWDGTDTLDIVNFADVWNPGTTDLKGIPIYGWDSDNNRAVPFQFNNAGELITSAAVSIEKVKIWDGTHYLDVFIPGEAFTLATSTGLATGGHDYAGGGAEVYYPIKVDSSGNQYVNLQDSSGTGITSTLIGAKQSLDINVAGGTIIADIEGDYVDDSLFTVAVDKGLAVGGVATSDSVNPNDFGVFRITTDRSLVTTIVDTTTDDDDDNIGAGQTTLLTIPLNYGYDATGGSWERLQTDGAGRLWISDGGGTITVDGTVTANVTGFITDDDDGSIAAAQTLPLIINENYGYHNTTGDWERLIVDTDDGLVASGQIPQVMINENYVYSSKVGAWIRWDGAGGYAFVLSRSEYVDDSAFTVDSDYGSACGGVFSADTVDAGDFGVFAINAAREQIVQAKQNGVWDIGTLGTITNEVDVDVNSWSLGAATTLGKIIITDGAQDCAVVDNGDAWQPGTSDHPGLPIYGYDVNNLAVPFKFNAAGNLMVDTEFVSNLDVYVQGAAWTLATSTGLGIGGHDYAGGAAEVWSPLKVSTTGKQFIDTVDTVTTLTSITNNVNTNLYDGAGVALTSTLIGADQSLDVNITTASVTIDGAVTVTGMIFEDDDGSLAAAQTPQLVIGENYGFDTGGNDWQRMLVELDDDSIASGRMPQLVIPLLYGYNGATWERLATDGSGALDVNVTNTVTVDCNSSNVTVDNAGGAAAVNIQDGGNTITVDGTVGVTGFTTDTDDDSIANAQTAQLTIPLLYGYDAVGGSWERLQTDGAGRLKVDSELVTDLDTYIQGGAWTLATSTGLGVGGHDFAGGAAEVWTPIKVSTVGKQFIDTVDTVTAVTTVTTLTGITNDVSIDDGGNTITVDGTVTSNQGGAPWSFTLTDTVDVLDIWKQADAYTLATSTGLVTGGHDYAGGAAEVYSPLKVSTTGKQFIDTVDTLTTITNVVHVDDNAGSLTIDNAALSVVGGGAEATALRVTIANDSTGLLSVDDNGGSLTVDGTVTSNQGGAPWSFTLTDTVDTLDIWKQGDAYTLATSTGLVFGGHDYAGGAAEVWSPIKVGTTGKQFIDTVDTVTTLTSITNNVNTNLFDGAGVALTSTLIGADQSLDVNITTASVTIDGAITVTGMVFDTDDDSVAGAQVPQLVIGELYGWDGANWERVQTDGAGALDVKPTGGIIDTLTTITNVVHVDDNAGSLTIDNAALSVVGGGAEATALRVTIANDSTGVLSVDDNGGSLTIDGAVTVTGMIFDTDDDAVADSQVPQLVLPLNYGYNGASWERLLTDGNGYQLTGLVDAAGNRMPAMDVVARAGYTYITDGANTMPTMDVAARKGFVQLTDGTDSLDIWKQGDAYTLATSTAFVIGGHDYVGGAAEVFYPIKVDAQGELYVDTIGTITNAVTISGFNTDTDDDSIAGAQVNQLVISQLYGWDTGGGTWERIHTDGSGAMDVDVNTWSLGAGTTLGKILITDGAQDCAVVDNGDAWQPGTTDHPGLPIYGYDTNNLAVPFKFNNSGELMVDAEITAEEVKIYDGTHYLDVYITGEAFTLATSTGTAIGGHDYAGGAAEVWNPLKVDNLGEITISAITNTVTIAGFNTDIDDDSIGGGQVNQLVTNLNYGYDTLGGAWQRLRTDGAGTLNAADPNVNYDNDDDSLMGGQTTLLTINELYGWDTAGASWERLRTDGAGALDINGTVTANQGGAPWSFTLTDNVDTLDIWKQADAYTLATSTGLVIGGHDYVGLGAEAYYPLKVDALGEITISDITNPIDITGMIFDIDDNSVADSQTPQLVLPLNYTYDAAGMVWERTLQDGAGNQYAHITDGANDMGVAVNAGALVNGIADYGFEGTAGVQVPKPLWAITGVAPNDYINPIGGHDYFGANTTRVLKVDAAGEITSHISDGVDVLDVWKQGDAYALVTSTNLSIGGHDYAGGAAEVFNPIMVDGSGAQYTYLAGLVYPPFMSPTQDEGLASIPVVSSSYGYYAAGAIGAKALPHLMDLDDGSIMPNQVPQLGIAENYNYFSSTNTWVRNIADDEDGAIATGQLLQLGINENYGYNAGAGNWVRQPAMESITNPGYQAISDGMQMLDVQQTGNALGTGILIFGELGATASSTILPIDSSGAAFNTTHLPIGGQDYRGVNAYALDVDTEGRVSIRDLGTDRLGVRQTVSTDTTSRALNTRVLAPDIWGDQYLYWYDDCECKNGGGNSICKWLPTTTGGIGWSPLLCADTHGVGYVMQDTIGSATFTTRPKEGDWMLKLWATTPEVGGLAKTECYTKLGEVTDKKMALEFWFSPGGLGFNPIAGNIPTNGIVFGFYSFDRRNNLEKRYLCRYNVNTMSWEVRDNVPAWTVIAVDRRPRDVSGIGWHTSAYWGWQYVKMVIDDSTGKVESLTYQDTTYDVDTVCETIAGSGGRSGFTPYFGAEFNCGYIEGDYYNGAIYMDAIKVYANDLQLDNTVPPQYTVGVP